MYGESKIGIKKLTNGYALYFRDPEIVKANREPAKLGKDRTYRDPEREMAFKSAKELTGFLEKNLDKLCVEDDYETSFTKALTESNDDD